MSSLNLALVIKADASGVAPATAEARREVQSVGTASQEAAAAGRGLAAANDEVAASHRRALEAARGRAQVERDLRDSVAKFAGISPVVTNDNLSSRRADIEAYGRALDELRARHNPLYAAQLQHEAKLTDIDRALRVGAISQSEHAQAIQRAIGAYELQAAALDDVAAATLRARLQEEEWLRQAAAGRQAWAADQAQSRINAQLGVRSPESMRGSAAASASVFAEIAEQAPAAARGVALASHEMTNLTYQMNDMAMMMALGQSPLMMIMQQGPQVAQIMGPRGLGEIIPALGGALRALITPTTMFLAGLTAVGYVGAGVFRAFRPEIEALDVALQRHIDRLGELEQGWKRTANAARSAGERSQLVTGFQSQQAIDALRRSFAQQTALGTLDPQLLIDRILPGPFGDDPSGVNYSVNASDRRLGLEPILMELMRSIEAGTPQIAKFNDELAAMGQAPEASSALKKRVAEILEFTAALGQAQAAINAYDRNFGPGGLLRGGSEFNRRDMQEYDRFRIEEQGKLNSMRREADARLLGIDARSPQERAAAARAAEAARFVADESAAVRALRIRIAETQALAEAEHQVAEASRERRRAMEETLAGAKLDVELTGRSVAETERLRLEHELLAQVRQQAADNGIAVSEAEIANIQRLAAEVGRLRAIQGAREILVGNQEQLERLRLERQLIGEGNVDRERMIALLEAEQEIRRLGIDAQGAEANAMRDNARAIAEETAELERGADAWRTYQSAGESAIDGLVDKLAKGDLKGAIEGLASDLGKTLLELSVSNPLKNAILGTNHGTLDDLGGIGGIFNRLLNGPSKADDSIVSSVLGGGQAVGSMSVTAAVVDVNGGIGGLPFEDGKGGGLLGLLGIDRPGATEPVIRMPLPAPGGAYGADLASNIRQLSANIGANPRDMAKLMSFESGLRADIWGGAGGRHYGLIQAGPNERATYGITPGGSLASQFAGIERYFVDRGFKSGMSGLDLYSTVNAGRPGLYNRSDTANGGTWGTVADKWNHQMGPHERVADRLLGSAGGASAALDKMTTQAVDAGKGLGELGGGLNNFAKQLSSTVSGAPAAQGAGGGGLLARLFGGGLNFFPAAPALGPGMTNWNMTGLWETGGYTGMGDPSSVAGLVHRGEFVMSAPAVKALGLPMLESLHTAARSGHGFRDGGYAGGSSWPSPAASPKRSVHFHGAPPGYAVAVEEETDDAGNERLDVTFSRLAAAEAAKRSSPLGRQMRAMGAGGPRVRR